MKKKQNQIKCIYNVSNVARKIEEHSHQAFTDRNGIVQPLIEKGEPITIVSRKQNGKRYFNIETSSGETVAFSDSFNKVLSRADRLRAGSDLYLKIGRKSLTKIDREMTEQTNDDMIIRTHIYEGESSPTGRRFLKQTFVYGLAENIEHTEDIAEFMEMIDKDIKRAKSDKINVQILTNNRSAFPEINEIEKSLIKDGIKSDIFPDPNGFGRNELGRLSTKLANVYRAKFLKQEKEAV